MDTQAIIARDDANVLHTYARSPVALTEGQGMYARDAEGRTYLDFTSGIGVNALGFCHPAWVQAVSAQAGRLQHTSNLYYTEPCGALAQELCRRTGLDAVFFGNSGAEANECAIKAARKYSADTYGPGRERVLTLVNSFHGRTLATLAATGQAVFHQDFGPFPEKFGYVPAGDLPALQAAVGPDTCALLLELVQGEGGVVALDPDYVRAAAEFCRARDILLLVDEVQTGVGRTGTFLACEQYGLRPDVVTLAKGLGGGLPIGAAVMSRKVADHMGPGSHGSTFGGNPVACAGALAVLHTLDEALLQNVRAQAARLRAGLAALPHVAEVSGLGLMVGVAFADGVSAAAVRAACERAGLLVLTAKTRLRLLPPLILTQQDVDQALAVLRGVLEQI